MALPRDQRFPVSFGEAFPLGLVLVGDIGPDTEFQPDRTKPAHQRVDEITGLRIWKAAVMDPSETKAKRASFEMFFLAEVQQFSVLVSHRRKLLRAPIFDNIQHGGILRRSPLSQTIP